jgi:berberine-like enzyme
VYVGLFFYELDYATDLLRFFRGWIKDAPLEYGAFPAFQIAPPLPFIPENRHGDTFCAAVVHWTGPLDKGNDAMRPFRDLAPVVAEMTATWPYPMLNGAFDVLFPKGIRSYWKGAYVTELTDAAIEQHVIHGSKVPEVSATMHLYPINGACHAVRSDETAFAFRDATFAAVIVAAWPDPAVDAQRRQWVRDYYDAIAPHSESGGYLGFMAEDDQDKVHANFAGNYTRLAEIKRAYDPDNLFHLNQNVKP